MGAKIIAAIIACVLFPGIVRADDRIKKFQAEIEQLSRELEMINTSESGVLGELRRLEAERRLRELELAQISLSIADTEDKLAASERKISATLMRIDDAKRYLSSSLSEIYKLGKMRYYRMIISAKNQRESILFFQYASYLADKDAKAIGEYRKHIQFLHEAKAGLDAAKGELLSKRETLAKKKEMLLRGESSRKALLASIRGKKEVHQEAINELKSACDELEKLVNSFGREGDGSGLFPLDARKFRGLFAWPSRGQVKSAFGKIKHPRFRTELPHNGIDIDASLGSDIKAVFDGKVVFAEWFKGYGLTIIMDHGSGILSIYAHASAILVEPGEVISKGSLLGKVGDSGSLQGAYLYFEIREDGKAVDPENWLTER